MGRIIPNENSWIGFVPSRGSAGSGPTLSSAVGATTGGTLAAGTYRYVVTALVGGVETVTSNEVSATVASGSTGSVVLTWTTVAGATGYRFYRSPVNGAAGSETGYIQVGAVTTTTDTGAALTTATPPFTPSTTSPVANLGAPSLGTELSNAVDLTAFTISITAQTTGNTVPTPSLSTRFETSIQGTYGGSFTADFYRDDTTDTAWLALPRNVQGVFVISRFGGKSSVKPGYVAVGDRVECWPIIVSSRSASNMTSNTAEMFTVTCSVPSPPNENAVVAA